MALPKIGEIQSHYTDDEKYTHIDVWEGKFDDEPDEEGKTIAVVCRDTKKVFYLDNLYRNIPIVQEEINKVLKSIDEEGQIPINELMDIINTQDTTPEQQHDINRADLKEMAIYYGGWDELRKVIYDIEGDEAEASFDSFVADFYGSDKPVTLLEQCQEAHKQFKR